MVGKSLGHYKVIEQIGVGGMGEVYLGEDTRLARNVAIKVLLPEMASDPDRLARFKREAKNVAALNHPNIVTIFSVEEADCIQFLTMELVVGRTLDALLPHDGFSLERFFSLAIPIADAVASAHGRDIVHRDLKPGNVMVTDEDGRVKVLDFGLAKLITSEAADGSCDLTTLTRPEAGLVVGTPHYMSPEQARGEEADHRSDIFSLGVMLFEMATGKRPFQGTSSIELLSSILKDTPPLLDDVKPELPRHLGRVIGRCLEKEPVNRYQTVRDLHNELEALRREGDAQAAVESSAAAPAAETNAAPLASIAVLPFTSLSADQEDEFFADGISEEIINALAQIPDLKVAARTSAFSFKGKHEDLRVVGETLGVSTVLEGSVRRAADRLRVTAQLIDAANGYQRWSERYDRQLDDVFEVQDDIARSIAERLAVTFARAGGESPVRPRASSVEAYELYLKGRHMWYQRTPALMQAASEKFERALELDPSFAPAWAGLSDCYSVRRAMGGVTYDDTFPRASYAARRVMELEADTAEAQITMAYHLSYYGDDWPAAERFWRRALELDPRSSLAHGQYALMLSAFGRREEAHDHSTRGRELDPLSPFMCALEAMGRFILGELEDSVASAQAAFELHLDYTPALWMGAHSLTSLGRYDEACEALKKVVESTHRSPLFVGMLGYARARGSQRERASRLLGELEDRAAAQYVTPVAPLLVQLGLGDHDGAERSLRACIADHTRPITICVSVIHELRELANEPRFADLIRELNVPLPDLRMAR